jgi:hypothetical protein
VHVSGPNTGILLLATATLAYVFAKVEIQIEGRNGWAMGLPTWRIERHKLLDMFFGGRPMTGYHAWMLPFMLLIFHFPAIVTWTWSWALEARMLAAMIIFWILEDVLWFLLNPAWGWRKFKPSGEMWHKRWFLWLPVDYWMFGVVASVLLWVAHPH